MATIKDLVNTALAEVGYLEKASNSNLDSKTGNAGSANYTKYARDFDQKYPNFYNGRKNGYSWCDVFVDWCFVQTFGVTEALRLLCQPQKSMGAGCDGSAGYYKSKNRWYTTPQVGDQVFFKSASYAYAHTGIVVEVTASQIVTVEGNTSGASGVISNGGGVCKKTYSRNYGNIVGYGRPVWTEAQQDVKINTTTVSSKMVTVSLPQIKFGSTGDSVEAFQHILNGMGFNCGAADGVWGAKTDAACALFQRSVGLTADKVCGKDTWSKALGA